jgi:hypothetical protein
LIPTRELVQVPKSIADSMDDAEVNSPKRKILLSKAVLENSTSVRVVISCKCKGQCASKRYRYVKEGVKCSVYCYSADIDHDCGNLASLIVRTEVALKAKKRARANTVGYRVE